MNKCEQYIIELEQRNSQLKQQNESEKEKLISNLAIKENEIEDLKKSIEESENEKEELISTLATKESVADDLKTRVELLDEIVMGLRSSVSQLQSKLEDAEKENKEMTLRIAQKEEEVNELLEHSAKQVEDMKELEKKLNQAESQLKETQAQLRAEEITHQSLKNRCAEVDALQNLYEQVLTENVSLKQKAALQHKDETESVPAEQKIVEKELPVTITAPEPIQPQEAGSNPRTLNANLESMVKSLNLLLSSTSTQGSPYESAISKSIIIILQHQLNLINSHVRPLPPIPDKAVHSCMNCGNSFTLFRRRQ